MPIVYRGYEPNGSVYLGNLVTMIKLMDFDGTGFEVKVLLADVHAFLNRKGNEEELNEEIEGWKKTMMAIGLNAEIVLGSSFEFSQYCQLDVMRLARACTIFQFPLMVIICQIGAAKSKRDQFSRLTRLQFIFAQIPPHRFFLC